MACYSPIQAYRSKVVNASGRRPLVFARNSGYVDLPVKIPCGICIGCRIMYSREWALRCIHEAKLHERNCFITLTYNDQHLPANQTLVKKDFQDFCKRLRKNYSQFRFYGCGEYGSDSKRPHYHALLFGIDFHEDRKKHSTNKHGDTIYISEILTRTWGKGHCTIGALNYQTAAYTARYVMKKMKNIDGELHAVYDRLDPVTGEIYQVLPEFTLMSRNPGVGSAWYDKFKEDFQESGFMVHQGKKHPVPRYYLNKLKNEDEAMHKELAAIRKAAALAHEADNTPDRLHARETFKINQVSTLRRNLQ